MKSKSTNDCLAYQNGGSMYCDKCGMNWDIDDEPPVCLHDRPIDAKAEINKMREILDDE